MCKCLSVCFLLLRTGSAAGHAEHGAVTLTSVRVNASGMKS